MDMKFHFAEMYANRCQGIWFYYMYVSLQKDTVTRISRYKQDIQGTLTQLKTNILS